MLAMSWTPLVRTGMRRIWTGSINITFNKKNTAVFTAGAPGAGKTYTINRLFGLDQFQVLDLDHAMRAHSEYNNLDGTCAVYEKEEAYAWADGVIETKFQQYITDAKGGRSNIRICVDGTGTKLERQRRRMQEARDAGFRVVCVYVKVGLEVCLERNARRKRQVPKETVLQ
jgi:predicted kinase